MKFTNKFSYPKHLYDWLVNDDYDYHNVPNAISATTLMKPVRAYWIAKRHNDDLVMDVSELIASRMGTAIHDSVEKVKTNGIRKEERHTTEFKIGDINYTLGGKFDILQNNEDGSFTLRDIKTTSVWAYVFGGKDDDYRLQLSIYRYLLSKTETNTVVTDHAYIDFFFTDWKKSDAMRNPDYPQARIVAGYRINLMNLQEVEEYIKNRLDFFDLYKEVEDDKLPFCTDEELWRTQSKWAVTKPDAKRSKKNCDSEEEAKQYISSNRLKGFVIQHRPGKVKRCAYCNARPFCSQADEFTQSKLLDF